MNPLLRRLASLRVKTRLLEGWRGVAAVLALVIGAVVLAGLLDWYLQLPSLLRAVLLVGILGGAGYLFYRYLLVPLVAPCDDLTLALRVEDKFPELNDSLASTVQFLQETGDSPAAGSESMRKHAIAQALAKAEGYDFNRVLNRRGLLALGASVLILLAVAAHFAYHYPQFSGIALRRLAEPYGGHTWTHIDVPDSPARVAVGQPYVIRGTLGGVIPAQAKIEVEGQTRTDKTVAVKRDEETGAGVLVAPLDMTQHKGSFKFRVLANDGSYPPRGAWHQVEVLPPPKLADLNGLPSPQVEVYPPAYTDVAPFALAPGTRHLELLAGTRIVMRGATDRPIQKAWVEYRPENPQLRAAALLGIVGADRPLVALGRLAAGHAVWGRIPAELDADGRVFTFDFTPAVTGAYVLHLEDQYGLAKDYVSDLRVIDDPLPVVKLHRPTSTLTLLPDAEVAFRFQAEDEVFALRSVFVEYQRKDEKGKLSEPQRVVLYSGPAYETALPVMLARLATSPLPGPRLHLRPRKLEVESMWRLRNQFKVGDKVFVDVGADDFCDIFGPRQPGRSHQIELHIVGKFELAKAIDEKLAEAQQELVRIQKWQQEARDIVKEIQGKKEITGKDVDRIVEAEQLQRQIKDRVGNQPDEGLRAELNKLQNLIKDNKLRDTEAQEQADMLKGALDQLARQELQQIEPALAQARRQMTSEEKKPAPGDKKEPGKQEENKQADDPLRKAENLQKNAKRSIDELVRAMNPWATLQQVKAETRSILEKQKEINKVLEDVKTRKETFDKVVTNKLENKVERRNLENVLRDELGKQAEQLAELAKRAEELNKLIGDKQAERAKAGDKENADRPRRPARSARRRRCPRTCATRPSRSRTWRTTRGGRRRPPTRRCSSRSRTPRTWPRCSTPWRARKTTSPTGSRKSTTRPRRTLRDCRRR
jgi:hypothetical protein